MRAEEGSEKITIADCEKLEGAGEDGEDGEEPKKRKKKKPKKCG